jgi:hypothetical protein
MKTAIEAGGRRRRRRPAVLDGRMAGRKKVGRRGIWFVGLGRDRDRGEEAKESVDLSTV